MTRCQRSSGNDYTAVAGCPVSAFRILSVTYGYRLAAVNGVSVRCPWGDSDPPVSPCGSPRARQLVERIQGLPRQTWPGSSGVVAAFCSLETWEQLGRQPRRRQVDL